MLPSDDFTDDRDDPQPMDLVEEGDDVDGGDGMDDGDHAGGGDDADLVACPSCGEQIREDSPRCPSCGLWLTADTLAGQRARGWFWPVMIALLIAVILVLWHGLGRS